jgi:hypothetical protein
MKLLKKQTTYKSTKEIEQDLRYAYKNLIEQKKFPSNYNKTLSITITHTNAKHIADLKFKLTNQVFNKIHSEHKNSLHHINYLYVIEYSEVISKGNFMPKSLDFHTHIVLNTSIPQESIEYYFNCFYSHKSHLIKKDIMIEDITRRTDKANYINYLLKQIHLFTSDNYNYKISLV